MSNDQSKYQVFTTDKYLSLLKIERFSQVRHYPRDLTRGHI